MRKQENTNKALAAILEYLNLILTEAQKETHINEELYALIDYYEDHVVDGYALDLYKNGIIQNKEVLENLEKLALNFVEEESIKKWDRSFWLNQEEIAKNLFSIFENI